MDNIKEIRNKVKDYIDAADDTTVKMMHAMLEVQQQSDWWDELSGNTQAEIDEAIKDLDEGHGIPHEKVKETYRNGSGNNLV